MIRKDDLIMASKKDFTLEELKKMYNDSLKESRTIGEMLRQKENEEEERKQAQLALDKETRKKEVDKAFENYNTLLKAYVEDYGEYAVKSDTSSFSKAFWPIFF